VNPVTIGAIENAILARVRAASESGVLGYRLRTVTTYQGEFEEQMIAELVAQFPAAWVVFAGEEPAEKIGRGVWKCRPTFVVVAGARNLRNEQARRHGAPGEPGSYQILQDLRALLIDQDLGLEIDPLAPGAVRSLFNGKLKGLHASLYAADLLTVYDLARPAATDAEAQPFLHFHADWDPTPLLPEAERPPAKPLPLPQADAQDDVTLQQ
jgi:phage gp37-like protein